VGACTAGGRVPATIGTDSRFRAFGKCSASLDSRLEEVAGLNAKTLAEMESDGCCSDPAQVSFQ
jgi:hypothetical protein